MLDTFHVKRHYFAGHPNNNGGEERQMARQEIHFWNGLALGVTLGVVLVLAIVRLA